MPYRTVRAKAPLFMRHKGVRVYHVYRHDDANDVFRDYIYTLDPREGSDHNQDGKVTFDVRNLSTWKAPPRPPVRGVNDTRKNRLARLNHGNVLDEAIMAAIRTAINNGEIGQSARGTREGTEEARMKSNDPDATIDGKDRRR